MTKQKLDKLVQKISVVAESPAIPPVERGLLAAILVDVIALYPSSDEPTGDRYVGEPEHIPAPVSGGTSTITGYDLGTRSMRIEPRGKPFCAHKRLLSRDNSDGGRITEATIQCSECGEWIQFRGMGGGVNRGAESK